MLSFWLSHTGQLKSLSKGAQMMNTHNCWFLMKSKMWIDRTDVYLVTYSSLNMDRIHFFTQNVICIKCSVNKSLEHSQHLPEKEVTLNCQCGVSLNQMQIILARILKFRLFSAVSLTSSIYLPLVMNSVITSSATDITWCEQLSEKATKELSLCVVLLIQTRVFVAPSFPNQPFI